MAGADEYDGEEVDVGAGGDEVPVFCESDEAAAAAAAAAAARDDESVIMEGRRRDLAVFLINWATTGIMSHLRLL